jgi:cytochrome P450
MCTTQLDAGNSLSRFLVHAAIFILFYKVFHTLLVTRHRKLPLPPGPRKLPVVGNLHQIPSSNLWRKYQQWHKQYGPIITIKKGPGTTIILGSAKVAKDLLHDRGSIYSSRPHMYFIGECVFGGIQPSIMPYGPKWRLFHKVQMAFVNVNTAQAYRPLQALESQQLLRDLTESDDFTKAFERHSTSLLYTLAYGKRIMTGKEEEMRDLEELGAILEKVLLEAARYQLPDMFPILNSLPAFLAPWKRSGQALFARHKQLLEKHMKLALEAPNWNWCKQAQKLGATASISATELAFVLGGLFEASMTTPMVLDVFVMASVLNPQAVLRAQAELDVVVGPDRLPSFEDKAHLPFMDAFIREVMRWRPITPGGFEHAVTQDDEYIGYHIPKGATVVANHWSIDLDDTIFNEPHDFKPERWIEQPNLPLATFGYGRRACPGRHIGSNSLYSVISCVLWAYRIEHAFDSGVRLEIDEWDMTQGADSKPSPFKASFRVRSQKHRDIIEKESPVSDKMLESILNSISASF